MLTRFSLAAIAATALIASLPSQAATAPFSQLKGNPSLQSASALVMDDQGNTIYGKDLDTIRPIASITKLMTAAQNYALVRQASTTQSEDVTPFADRGPLTYVNTNRLLKNSNWEISLSKTGYLNESGRCLVMHAKIAGEPVFIVLLNSYGKLTPFGDSNRLLKWMLAP